LGGDPEQPVKFSVLKKPNGPWQILGKNRSAGGPPGHRTCRSVGRGIAEPLGRKQVGRLVLGGIAAHAEDIAALGIVRQSRIWRLEPSDIYIIKINASANMMPTRRRMPQNTILINRQASPSSAPRRISRSLHGSAEQRRKDYRGLFYIPMRHFLLFLPTNSG